MTIDTITELIAAKCIYRNMQLLTNNHHFMICGSYEDLGCAIIHLKCGVKTNSGRKEGYIRKTTFSAQPH